MSVVFIAGIFVVGGCGEIVRERFMTRASCRLVAVGAFVGDESLDNLLCGLSILLGVCAVVFGDSSCFVGSRYILDQG